MFRLVYRVVTVEGAPPRVEYYFRGILIHSGSFDVGEGCHWIPVLTRLRRDLAAPHAVCYRDGTLEMAKEIWKKRTEISANHHFLVVDQRSELAALVAEEELQNLTKGLT